MLSRLDMTLSGAEQLNYQMASLFHGALMEMLPEAYVAELHESMLHPYTQHLEMRNHEWHWVVTALNDRAKSIIIDQTLAQKNQVDIKKHELVIGIAEKKTDELTDKELSSQFYQEDAPRTISLQFLTPTAFKIDGRYVFYPDIRSIYLSLMNKYDAASKAGSMRDEDALELLCRNTSLFRYDLRSTLFSMEGVKIPSFVGKVAFRMHGAQTMTNLAQMLFRFGEYSGIGIKTALGMGAVKLLSEEEMRGRRHSAE
ncbi:MAG: CRISPR-associated endoribonuclease Cas6 [Eubacteriales bacterium]|nr:CRISPR-associated endoribonuclease Cas6 [Eubacteriales bacterium]